MLRGLVAGLLGFGAFFLVLGSVSGTVGIGESFLVAVAIGLAAQAVVLPVLRTRLRPTSD